MDAVIVMAGNGSRLNAGINKVFLKLNNKPIFAYSLELLKKYCDKVILVIKPDELDLVKDYLDDRVMAVYGGSERYLSVNNGIEETKSDFIIIHDGARPFVDENLIKEAIAKAEIGMFCGQVKDTIYQDNLKLLDRSKLLAAKTPQIIRRDIYLNCFNKALKDGFIPTDEISLIRRYSDEKINLYYDEANFKITTKIDYLLAQEVVKCIE